MGAVFHQGTPELVPAVVKMPLSLSIEISGSSARHAIARLDIIRTQAASERLPMSGHPGGLSQFYAAAADRE